MPTVFAVDGRHYRLEIGFAQHGRSLADDEVLVAEVEGRDG